MAAAKKPAGASKAPAKKPAAKRAPAKKTETGNGPDRENPVVNPPQAPPPTTPTDPKDAEALAAATAADIAGAQPDPVATPSDLAAGTDGGADLADLGPSPVSANKADKIGKPELSDRDHAEHCPAERLEAYPANRPNGETVKVSHCIDCGATAFKKL